MRAAPFSSVVPAEGPNFLVERNFVFSERLLLCAPSALASPVAVRSGGVSCAVVWWCGGGGGSGGGVCCGSVCVCVGCVWMGGVWVR